MSKWFVFWGWGMFCDSEHTSEEDANKRMSDIKKEFGYDRVWVWSDKDDIGTISFKPFEDGYEDFIGQDSFY